MHMTIVCCIDDQYTETDRQISRQTAIKEEHEEGTAIRRGKAKNSIRRERHSRTKQRKN